MTDRELMQQVLEDICGAKLCEINSMSSRVEMIRLMDSAITALRERLAQPEREWVGLTKEEAKEISMANRPYVVDMIAALEARLKEKNT